MPAQLDALRVNRHRSVLTVGTLVTGTNLLTNPGFETGAFGAGWPTNTDCAIIAASTTDVGVGNYMCEMGVLGYPETPRLESARVAVSAGTKYTFAFRYGADLSSDGGGNQYFTARIRWWNASGGGSEVATSVAVQRRLSTADESAHFCVVTYKAPAGATYASVRFELNFSNDAGGPYAVLDEIVFAAMVTTTRPNLIESLDHVTVRRTRGFEALVYATNARSGYEEMSFRVRGDPAYLWDWLQNGLTQHIEAYYETTRIFEGFVHTLRGRIAGTPWSISYDVLYNDIVLDYTNNSRDRVMDANSIYRYGRKQLVVEDNNILGYYAAHNRAKYLRRRHSKPKPISSEDVDDADNYLDVTVSGYWNTLQWIETAHVWYAYLIDTSVAIATGDVPTDNRSVLETVRDLYSNPFISNDYSRVQETGNQIKFDGGGSGKKFDETGNAQELIINLLNLGDSAQRFLVSGVWQDRQFVLAPRPTTAGYYFERNQQNEMVYRDAGGALLPNALLVAGLYRKQVTPVPGMTSYSDIEDDPTALFLWQVQYDSERDQITVTPPDADTLDRGLARALRWSKI